MKKLILILALTLVSFAYLSADVYIKQETKIDPATAMGQKVKNTVSELWFGKNKMATKTGEMNMIMNMDAKKAYIISPKTKTYVESGLPMDMTKLMPEAMAPMLKTMLNGMTVAIKPNGQTKKVGNWDTKGYDVNMKMMGMDMKMVYWVASNVGFDWKAYSTLYSEMYKVQFQGNEKFVEEFKKLDGYPVAIETTMMGMKTSTLVTEINPNKAPTPDVYAVPAGYRKTERVEMGMGSK
ncbi:MAG: DUF4412 domain-containing protein [Candidatus Omnitrophota bacterium]